MAAKIVPAADYDERVRSSFARQSAMRTIGAEQKAAQAELTRPTDRRAIRRAPTASASVIVGSRPSGTLATSSPIAKFSASASGRPTTIAASLIGIEAYRNYQRSKAAPWVQSYKWAILCFIAVGFWNVVGAGLLGFSINTPIALYYMQGMNMTAAHGHAALFGVYGMLGIGLMLFCLRGLKPDVEWNEKVLRTSFWALNIGLAGMAAFTLLPLGILQLNAALDHGYWYARSAEFMQQPIVDLLVWMRVPADTIFSVGALALAWFVFRLWVAPRRVAVTDALPAKA